MSDKFQKLKTLIIAKNNLLEDEGPISYLPVKVDGGGRYHMLYKGEAIVLCYNSVTDTTFLMEIAVERRVTSGPSNFKTMVNLLECDNVWAEHVLQDENLEVKLPKVEKSIEISYETKTRGGDGRVIGRNARESFDKLPHVPQKNMKRFLEKLEELFMPLYVEPDSSLENLKKLYEKPFPGYSRNWVQSRAKSAKK